MKPDTLTELTRKEAWTHLRYDPDTGLLWWVRRGRRRQLDRPAGCVKARGYIYVMLNCKVYRAHRLIWFMQTGEWPKEVDHINRNPSDNRWVNLREVTTSENHSNRRKKSTSPRIHVCNGRRYVRRQNGGVDRYILLCDEVS